MICDPCVWPLLYRIPFPLLFFRVRQGRYARMYYCGVCAVTAVPQGCGPQRAECVGKPSVRTTLLLLLAPTNTVLGGWYPLAIVAAVLVHVVCVAHRVDDSLICLTACRVCAYWFLFFFLVVG
ncbi:retrotransposon hot spot (RHS) protein [Trypanosoma cruzi]|nr:retrotransposon hot spot (RHS) protein [Trypanosoma cruzi]